MRRVWLKWALLLFLGGVAFSATPCRAWDARGHEQIADLAWGRLRTETRLRIGVILNAGDPELVPNAQTDRSLRAAFRHGANFPDRIKDEARPTSYEEIIPRMNARWDPEHDPHVSPREVTRCKTWHYLDIPLHYTGERPGAARSNAAQALTLAVAELRRLNRERRDLRMQAWWLYWIEHLVGDMHQPLHCASSYRFHADGDAGGNRFSTGGPDPRNPNRKLSLHAYWDGGIGRAIKADGGNSKERGVRAVSRRWNSDPALKPPPGAAGSFDFARWIADGAGLAESAVYEGLIRGELPSAAYRERHEAACRKQAVLAGARLAALLEDVL